MATSKYWNQLNKLSRIKYKKTYKKLNRLFMPTLLEIFDKKRVTKDL